MEETTSELDLLKTYMLGKINEVTPIVVHNAYENEIREIVREEVKNYLSRFMLVIPQQNDKS